VKLFDTHCHFETTDEAAIRAMLARAKSAGVEALMAVGGSDALNEAALAAQRVAMNDESLPRVAVALGYDREQVGLVTNDELRMTDEGRVGFSKEEEANSAIRNSSFAIHNSLSAVGEVGLDYYYSHETREAQMKLFAEQLELARTKDLPVVIHTREADDDTLALLREIPSKGIIHCYTGTPEAARAFLDLGFYISISGIVTFRAADNVRAAARVVPDDRILIETDAPFLAPVPMRGKPNEPAFISYTCAFLADQRGMSAEEFALLTYSNAEAALSEK